MGKQAEMSMKLSSATEQLPVENATELSNDLATSSNGHAAGLIRVDQVSTGLNQTYIHPHVGIACLLQDIRSSLPLLLSDVLAIIAAWSAAYWICELIGNQGVPGYRSLIGLPIVVPIGFLFLRLYPAATLHPAFEIQQVVVCIALIFLGLFAGAIFYTEQVEAVLVHRSVHFLMMILWIPSLRILTRGVCSRFLWWRQPTLIFGSQSEIKSISTWIKKQWYLGIRPVGYAASKSMMKHPTRVIISTDAAFSSNFDGDVSWAYPRAIFLPELLQDLPGLAFTIDGGMMGNQTQNRLCSPFQRVFKRLLDLGLILITLPFWIPVFIFLAIAVRLSSPGPIFYRQERLGRNSIRFGAWKFRTMIENADDVLQDHLLRHPEMRAEWDRDHKLKDDPRVTKIGSILRKSSLDELPQLFNVFCGQMSLVGPRPIVDAEIPKYGSTYKLYERVTPGITGLWQISGRNNTSYQERLHLDEFYVRNWSIWLDFFILLRTIKTVVFREGAY